MTVTGKLKAGSARRVFTLAASAAVVLPSLIAAAAPQAAAEKAPAGASLAPPVPCKATLFQIFNEMFFSSEASWRNLVPYAKPGSTA